MFEEMQPAPEQVEIPATTPEPTVGSETASVSEEQQPEVKDKVFTQEELDRILAKNAAKLERRLRREADQRVTQALKEAVPKATESDPGRPKPENFKETEDYIEAVTEWKAKQIVRTENEAYQRAQMEARARVESEQISKSYQAKEDDAREKYSDFDQVAYQTPYECSPAMAQAIQLSDVGPDLAYYLGKHPEEASRIAHLHPLRAAQELGKLEVKISESQKTKPSSAPEPIKPVNARGETHKYDTTDPRSDKMNTSDWIEAENERMRKKYAAKGYR